MYKCRFLSHLMVFSSISTIGRSCRFRNVLVDCTMKFILMLNLEMAKVDSKQKKKNDRSCQPYSNDAKVWLTLWPDHGLRKLPTSYHGNYRDYLLPRG